MKLSLHTEQLLALALQHPLHRNPRPLGHNLRNILRSHGFRDYRVFDACLAGIKLIYFLLSLCHFPVAYLGNTSIVTGTLGIVGLYLVVLHLLACLLESRKDILFLIPAASEDIPLLTKLLKLLLNLIHLERNSLTLDGLPLYLELAYPAVKLCNRLRDRVHLKTQLGSCLVNKVNGLVRKETVGDIAVRQFHSRYQRVILNTDLVMVLIALLESPHYGDGCGRRRLINHHHLETSLESLVRLKILLVFVKCSRADCTQFPARKSRLKDIRCIHSSGSTSGAHQCMDFVNEQDNLSVTVNDFLHHAFKTLFKFSLVFRARNKRTEVKRIYLPALEVLRNIPVDYLLCYAFGNGRLADTRFTDKNRVVLCSPAENLKYPPDFLVPADDRVEFALCRPFIEIDGESAEIFKFVFCHNKFSFSFPETLRQLHKYAGIAVRSEEQTAISQNIFQMPLSDKMSASAYAISISLPGQQQVQQPQQQDSEPLEQGMRLPLSSRSQPCPRSSCPLNLNLQ